MHRIESLPSPRAATWAVTPISRIRNATEEYEPPTCSPIRGETVCTTPVLTRVATLSRHSLFHLPPPGRGRRHQRASQWLDRRLVAALCPHWLENRYTLLITDVASRLRQDKLLFLIIPRDVFDDECCYPLVVALRFSVRLMRTHCLLRRWRRLAIGLIIIL